MGGFYHGYGMPGGWGILGMLPGLLISIGVLVLLVMVIRYFAKAGDRYGHQGHFRHDPERGDTEDTAEDILKKRYARGEITKEEFDRIRADLK